MCGMGNLTRAAYANQRMTLDRKLAKFNAKAEYDDRATWSNPQWRVFIIHVLARRLAMPLSDVGVWEHATLFSARGIVAERYAQKKVKENGYDSGWRKSDISLHS